MLILDDILGINIKVKHNLDLLSSEKFNGISIDSRSVKKSELFIAIKGENTDGHKYINDVFSKEIKLAIVNESWFKKNKDNFNDKSFVVVKDTIKALGELARNYKRKFQIKTLCIGGSNGKTTTKDLIYSVLSKKYKVLKNIGSFNNHIGVPLTIFNLNDKYNFCVLEIGCNHFGELEYLCNIAEPEYGLITNIGKEHLEFFKNLDGVAKAEFELFDYLQTKNESISFLNFDDEYIRKYSAKFNEDNILTYSYNFDTDIRGNFIKYNKKFEPEIEIYEANRKFNTNIATFGKHSIYNGLAAAAIGLYFEIGAKEISEALANFRIDSNKRMEVRNVNGKIIINDTYNSNPDSVRLGLETLKEYKTNGKKFIVLSDMLELGEKSEQEHKLIGKLIDEMGFENLLTWGKESKFMNKGARKVKNNIHFDSKAELISYLKKNISSKDLLYVKGSRGMKMEEVVDSIL